MKREQFLGRVRARLAAAPDAQREVSRPAPGSAADARGAADSDSRELAARFAAELSRVGGALIPCADSAEAASKLEDFLGESGARSLAAFERPCFAGLPLDALWGRYEVVTPSSHRDFRARVPQVDVGLSVADLGVAASGSLLFLAAPERPRSVTLLPRSHVAILRASTLVADLGAACRWLADRGTQASSSIFVTGPSRTSDIENDLTLGVHGPAAVTVFLLQDPH